jgi:hypothetical protein
MRRLFLAAVVPLFLLAACTAPGSSGPPVQVTRAQVTGSAQLAAATLEMAWQGYLAVGGKMVPDVIGRDRDAGDAAGIAGKRRALTVEAVGAPLDCRDLVACLCDGSDSAALGAAVGWSHPALPDWLRLNARERRQVRVWFRHRSQQHFGVIALRMFEDAVGRASFNNLAATDQGNAVADVTDHAEVVRDE